MFAQRTKYNINAFSEKFFTSGGECTSLELNIIETSKVWGVLEFMGTH